MFTDNGHSDWTLEQFQEAAQKANSQDEYLVAIDLITEALDRWLNDEKLRQMHALALARLGSYEQAHAILQQLVTEGHRDSETLGLIARTYKDAWLRSRTAADLAKAYDAYHAAFREFPASYWMAINAATLAYLQGDLKRSRELATEVRSLCGTDRSADPSEDPFWLVAARAHACLLLDLPDEAEENYRRAAKLGRGHVGNVLSSWRNARLILSGLPSSVNDRIKQALQVPGVAVFSGHRIDEGGRPYARFPEHRAEEVQRRISERLLQHRAEIGYSSAASGGDILFLEAMQALKGKTHIVLPCNKEQFIQESVATSGEQWVERLHEVMKRATDVIVASPQRLSFGSIAYDFSNELLYGLARLRARQNGIDLVHIAVWDGRDSNRRGGTADVVSRWRQRTPEIVVIPPLDRTASDYEQAEEHNAPGPMTESAAVVPGLRSEVRAMLFADAFHFSQLSETQIPVFLRHFMGEIAALLRETSPQPLFQNTWGDGLYVVFATVADAGRFALALVKRIGAIDRDLIGVPQDLTLRISLHAGPVYVYMDEIIHRNNYIGSHVNRAARVEPITAPGHVYATDAFAALAELEAPDEFRFEYKGKVPLAKDYGKHTVYELYPTSRSCIPSTEPKVSD